MYIATNGKLITNMTSQLPNRAADECHADQSLPSSAEMPGTSTHIAKFWGRTKTFVYKRRDSLLFVGFLIFVVFAHLNFEDKFVKRYIKIDANGEKLLVQRFKLYERFYERGYFSEAVKHGYNIFTNTPKNAARFTGNEASCVNCHSYKEIGYSFVTMDRYDPERKKRISFEEKVRGCYVKHLDGHVPPFFDPALQDVKIFARFMSIGLALQEGSLLNEKNR